MRNYFCDITVNILELHYKKYKNNFKQKHSGPVFLEKVRIGYVAISTNTRPVIYRNLYENTGPA